MNAAFLIMSTAALAGADPVPPPPLPAAPVVVSGAGCNNCGASVVSSGCCGSSKAGLFDRLKGRMGGGFGFGRKHNDCGCAPAPTCYAPAPTCAPVCQPAPTCCGSVANRPNLFDTIKSRCGSKKNKHGPCCTPVPSCDPCATGAVLGGPPAGPIITNPGPGVGTPPPKEMPKPKDEKPKGNTGLSPAPLPAVPTVNGAGASSPY